MNITNATALHADSTPARADRRRPRRTLGLGRLADGTLIQASIAGVLSFTHIRDIAVAHGQDGWKGWAYPLTVDLLTVAAYRRLKRDQADGKPTGLAWTWFTIALLFSLGANVADAVAHAPAHASRADLTMNIIIGMWPAAAFLGSTLLRHSDKPTDRPAAVDEPATGKPARQAAPRQPAAIVQPLTDGQPTATDPRPIPVKPTSRPQLLGDLGPRADVGELPLPVWVAIGQPVYQQIKGQSGGRPTEKALQAALAQRVAELIRAGTLPAAVGQPSGSTAKRIRRAIETQHPELTARADQPRQLAIASA